MIKRHRDGFAACCQYENKVLLGFVEGSTTNPGDPGWRLRLRNDEYARLAHREQQQDIAVRKWTNITPTTSRRSITIAPTFPLRCRLFARPAPPWVFHAVSVRFEYHVTLLQGFIGAIEPARRAAAPRTIAVLEEGLPLGVSRLHVGRYCGGYHGKSYEDRTHTIAPGCAFPSHDAAGDHGRREDRGDQQFAFHVFSHSLRAISVYRGFIGSKRTLFSARCC
jgi:hypothetical protein